MIIFSLRKRVWLISFKWVRWAFEIPIIGWSKMIDLYRGFWDFEWVVDVSRDRTMRKNRWVRKSAYFIRVSWKFEIWKRRKWWFLVDLKMWLFLYLTGFYEHKHEQLGYCRLIIQLIILKICAIIERDILGIRKSKLGYEWNT